MDFKKHALVYARAGLPIFPLTPGQKIPIKGTHGVIEATTDEATILEWGVKYPDANIGFHPAAHDPAWIVLDFDSKSSGGVRGEHPNGLDTYEEFKMAIPELEDAWIQSTPTGGLHLFFRNPEGFECLNMAPVPGYVGFDIRYKNAYVLLSPSTHPEVEEDFYRWIKKEGLEPPVLPSPMVGILTKAMESKRSQKPSQGPLSTTLDDDEEIHARNVTLHSIGASLRARGLDRDSIKAALMSINERRCRPEPLPEWRIDHIIKNNMNLQPYVDPIESAKRMAQRKLGKPIPAPRPVMDSKAGEQKLKLLSMDKVNKRNIDWLIPGFIAKGVFNMVFGESKNGKSYTMLEVASRISLGLPLPGVTALESKPGSVILICYEEDPELILKHRLECLGADMKRLHILDYTDPEVSPLTYKDIKALRNTIKDMKDLQMVVVDPVNFYMAGKDECNNLQVRECMTPLLTLAAELNFALVGIKHPTKTAGLTLAQKLAGSGAWRQLARTMNIIGLDNRKEQDMYHKYGGMVSLEANISGGALPIPFEIDNGVVRFGDPDPSMTGDDLIPLPPKKDDKKS